MKLPVVVIVTILAAALLTVSGVAGGLYAAHRTLAGRSGGPGGPAMDRQANAGAFGGGDQGMGSSRRRGGMTPGGLPSAAPGGAPGQGGPASPGGGGGAASTGRGRSGGMQGMPGMQGMQGMPGMQGMQRMPGMPRMQGPPTASQSTRDRRPSEAAKPAASRPAASRSGSSTARRTTGRTSTPAMPGGMSQGPGMMMAGGGWPGGTPPAMGQGNRGAGRRPTGAGASTPAPGAPRPGGMGGPGVGMGPQMMTPATDSGSGMLAMLQRQSAALASAAEDMANAALAFREKNQDQVAEILQRGARKANEARMLAGAGGPVAPRAEGVPEAATGRAPGGRGGIADPAAGSAPPDLRDPALYALLTVPAVEPTKPADRQVLEEQVRGRLRLLYWPYMHLMEGKADLTQADEAIRACRDAVNSGRLREATTGLNTAASLIGGMMPTRGMAPVTAG